MNQCPQTLSLARFARGAVRYSWSTPAYSLDLSRIAQTEAPRRELTRPRWRRLRAARGLFRRWSRRLKSWLSRALDYLSPVTLG
jgi:hypothetical protein